MVLKRMSYTVSLKAYSKILLHCAKYPHKAVNGVVIGSVSKETQSVQIQDAIPLFHLGIGLAPMLEVALTQVNIGGHTSMAICQYKLLILEFSKTSVSNCI